MNKKTLRVLAVGFVSLAGLCLAPPSARSQADAPKGETIDQPTPGSILLKTSPSKTLHGEVTVMNDAEVVLVGRASGREYKFGAAMISVVDTGKEIYQYSPANK